MTMLKYHNKLDVFFKYVGKISGLVLAHLVDSVLFLLPVLGPLRLAFKLEGKMMPTRDLDIKARRLICLFIIATLLQGVLYFLLYVMTT